MYEGSLVNLPLKPVIVFKYLMAKGRAFQSFGAAYVNK